MGAETSASALVEWNVSEFCAAPNVWRISIPHSAPVMIELVPGMARIQASVPLTDAMPSAQAWALPSLISEPTTPSTRSAVADGLFWFHDWKNWSS